MSKVDPFENYRVEIPLSHPLAKSLRPSKSTLERIEQQERATAIGYQAVRNMLVGSYPHGCGVACPGRDWISGTCEIHDQAREVK